MARFRRRRRLRRRRLPRRRFRRKRATTFRRRGRRVSSRSYLFKYKFVDDDISVEAAAISGVFTYSLDKLLQSSKVTNLVALFDNYKLAAVKTEFVFDKTVNTMAYNPTSSVFQSNNLPTITTCIDYNDDIAPSTENELLNYGSSRVTSGRYLKRYFKPRFLNQLYESVTFTGYAPKRGYVATQDPSVPHFGLKYYIQPNTDPGIESSVGLYRVYHTYYLKFIATK